MQTVDGVNSATLEVAKDGEYHVSTLFNGDAVNLTDDYLIELIPDDKPVVKVLKPGRDWRASNIEEVTVRVEASDDFGLDRVEVRYSINGGEWQTAPIDVDGNSVVGQQMLFLEEMTQAAARAARSESLSAIRERHARRVPTAASTRFASDRREPAEPADEPRRRRARPRARAGRAAPQRRADDAPARARRRHLVLRRGRGSRPRGADRFVLRRGAAVQPQLLAGVAGRRRWRRWRRRPGARRDLAAAEGDPRRDLEPHQGAQRGDVELSRRAAAARQRADARRLAAHARRAGAHAREPHARARQLTGADPRIQKFIDSLEQAAEAMDAGRRAISPTSSSTTRCRPSRTRSSTCCAPNPCSPTSKSRSSRAAAAAAAARRPRLERAVRARDGSREEPVRDRAPVAFDSSLAAGAGRRGDRASSRSSRAGRSSSPIRRSATATG